MRLRASGRMLAESQVKEKLKDPDSANYRDVTLFESRLDIGDGKTVAIGSYTLCGEVNAKNAFGGYTGYTRFISTLTFDPDKHTHFGNALFEDRNEWTFDVSGHRISFDKAYTDECRNEVDRAEASPGK